MKLTALDKRHHTIIFVWIFMLAIAATVLGCGWGVGTDHSVRFNPFDSEQELGRLPQLRKYERSTTNNLFPWQDHDTYEGGWAYDEANTKNLDEVSGDDQTEQQNEQLH